jgi:hypothetical protein
LAAERPSSWLVVREAVSRWQVAHRRAVMVAKRRRRCPQQHGGVVAQRGRWAWWPPGGTDASRAIVSVPVSSASVRSPVSGAGVQHHACLSTRPLSSVRCGRLSVQMSGVQRGCPVSGVDVRCGRPGGCGGWRWAGSRLAGMAGVGVVACPVHDQFVVCPGRNLTVEAGAGRAGSGEGSAWTWPSSWAVVGQWRGRPRGRPGLAGWARGSPVGDEPGCAARRRLRCVVIVWGPGPSRLGAASLLGWTATWACGRGAAAACSERRRLDAGDALTCEVGGGGEGI